MSSLFFMAGVIMQLRNITRGAETGTAPAGRGFGSGGLGGAAIWGDNAAARTGGATPVAGQMSISGY